MKKILSLLVIASSAFVSLSAFAEDKPAAVVTPPAAAAPATAPTPVADVAKSETGVLKDGTKFEIGGDGIVTLTNTDGTKSTAPDGVLTLKDDTTFNVKEGKKVMQ